MVVWTGAVLRMLYSGVALGSVQAFAFIQAEGGYVE